MPGPGRPRGFSGAWDAGHLRPPRAAPAPAAPVPCAAGGRTAFKKKAGGPNPPAWGIYLGPCMTRMAAMDATAATSRPYFMASMTAAITA